MGQEGGGVGTVHLGMMKLERDLKGYARFAVAYFVTVFRPNHEGVVVDAAVHAYCAVDVVLDERGCADDHTLRFIMVYAGLLYLSGEFKIIAVEFVEVVAERHIA